MVLVDHSSAQSGGDHTCGRNSPLRFPGHFKIGPCCRIFVFVTAAYDIHVAGVWRQREGEDEEGKERVLP